MIKLILTLFISTTIISSAVATPFLHFFNAKKMREVKFIAETYGPAAFKCYYQITNGADFSLQLFKKAHESGKMSICLQDKAMEQAEYLREIPNSTHR
ncbi:MAG: hypothetical protein ACI9TY_001352 [Alphaproteobacteria bacterium]|jgi:hypothetical protein